MIKPDSYSFWLHPQN